MVEMHGEQTPAAPSDGCTETNAADGITRRQALSYVALAITTPAALTAWGSRCPYVTNAVASLDQARGSESLLFPLAHESYVNALSQNGYSTGGIVEAAGEHPKAFFHNGRTGVVIAPEAPYQHIETTGVSSNALVVGRFYSPAHRSGVAGMLPFVFNAQSGEFEELPLPNEQKGGIASQISDDGTKITGSADGGKPCVWEKNADGSWSVEILKGPEGQVVYSADPRMSSNGLRIAAGYSPQPRDNRILEWSKHGGDWVCFERFRGLDVSVNTLNNDGFIGGSVPARSPSGGPTAEAALIDPFGRLHKIGWLEGHDHSYVSSSNNNNLILITSQRMGNPGEAKMFLFNGDENRKINFDDPRVMNCYGRAINDSVQLAGVLDSGSQIDAPFAFVWRPTGNIPEGIQPEPEIRLASR